MSNVRFLLPASASAYFAFYVAFCLWAHHEDFSKQGSFSWVGFGELTSNALLVLAALSFWFPAVRAIPTTVLLGLFSVGCLLFFLQGLLTAHKTLNDATISSEGRAFTAIAGTAFAFFISSPLLYWGWQATIEHIYAET